MRATDRLRWRSLGSAAALWVGSIAAARAATGTVDFPVKVTLHPPPGCVVTAGASGAGSAPQVTLTCGSNLFVNVQPTILPSPTSSTTTGAPPAASFTAPGGAPAPPAELTQSIASLMNLSDTSTSAGGSMFVQRSAAATSSALTPGRTMAQALQPGSAGSPNAMQDSASDPSGQAVEVWLIF